LYQRRSELVAAAQALVAACDCKHGCPSCVGPILGTDETGDSAKSAARRVLTLLMCPS
jgi:DEAD/DEAH box helicase domain-containing protein